MARVRRWIATLVLALGCALAGAPVVTLAQDDDVEQEARLEGYGGNMNVKVENDSTGLVWLLFIVMAVISLGVLFKDAKRTHLD